jgi:cytochrome P450
MFDLVVATVPWGFFIPLAAAICSLFPWILGTRRTVKKHKEGGRGSKYSSTIPRPATPPIAAIGFLEMIRAPVKEGTLPWMFEQIAQDTGSDTFYFKPMKRYIVGDAEVAREILLDDLSVKSKDYEILNLIVGNRNIFTSVKNDNIWHTTRKAINRSFSTVETKRMNDIALMQISKWIDEKLEPAIANNAAIDPSLEMTRITFKVITEAAFEYKATDKEFELFVHNTEVAFKHVMTPAVIVPFWKYIGPLFSSYREGMRSSAEMQAFGKRILDSYRENPNKSSNNTIIKVLATPGICTDEAQRVSEILVAIIGKKEQRYNHQSQFVSC